MTKIKYGQKILTNTLKRSDTNSINMKTCQMSLAVREIQMR